MDNPNPTPPQSQSMRDLQSQAPSRMGPEGNVIQPRLAQSREKQQGQEAARAKRPAQEGGKLIKYLPWIATGAALGGGLFLDFL